MWAKLIAGLDAGLRVSVSGKTLRDLRRRVGAAPLRALFEVLAGPVAQPTTPGVRYGRYRTVAFDGCVSIKAPDTGRNRSWLGKMRATNGVTGYPVVELTTLVETGTRPARRSVRATDNDAQHHVGSECGAYPPQCSGMPGARGLDYLVAELATARVDGNETMCALVDVGADHDHRASLLARMRRCVADCRETRRGTTQVTPNRSITWCRHCGCRASRKAAHIQWSQAPGDAEPHGRIAAIGGRRFYQVASSRPHP